MWLWIRLALRNALRNVRRTGLTVTTVLVAVAILTLGLSWIGGIFGSVLDAVTAVSGHIRIVDEDFAAREELYPLYENIEDSAPLVEKLKAVPGVVDVEPRIVTGAVITAGEEIGEDFTLVTAGTRNFFEKYLHGPESIASGRWLQADEGEVVLGRKIALQIDAHVGEKILLMGQTQYGSMSPISVKVVGIVAGDGMLNSQAFITLDEARYLTDIPNGALEILVYAKDREVQNVAPLAKRIRALNGLDGLLVQSWYERAPWNSVLGIIFAIRTFIQLLIVFVAALAIFNTMTMSVLERTNEIGVMRAMGLTRLGAVGLFLMEALAIGFVGGMVGALIGSIPAHYLQVHGVTLGEDLIDRVGDAYPMKATFYAHLTWGVFLQCSTLGLVIAALGALFPALRASGVAPVVAMKARR